MTLRKLISASFLVLLLTTSALHATKTFGADDEFDTALERDDKPKIITIAQLNNILNENRHPFTGKVQPQAVVLPAIEDGMPHRKKKARTKVAGAVQHPNKTVQIEQDSVSLKGLSSRKDKSHKLIFERDREGNFLNSKAGLTASWKPFNEDDLKEEGAIKEEMQQLLRELIEEKGEDNINKDHEPKAYTVIRSGIPQRSLIKVGTTMGGGDCGFFAYGRQTSRSVFINRMINALLFPDTHLSMSNRRELHSLVTNEVFQKACLDEDGHFLKAIGSKKTFEELFQYGPENARIKPYILANFVYKVYAQELECLSFHMLKALALVDAVSLCIWTEDNSQKEKQGPTLKLEDHVVSFPQAETKHIFYDGRGHFSTAIEGNNDDELKKLEIKSVLSLALTQLLQNKGIGAQEYKEYTELMKTLYQGLCS